MLSHLFHFWCQFFLVCCYFITWNLFYFHNRAYCAKKSGLFLRWKWFFKKCFAGALQNKINLHVSAATFYFKGILWAMKETFSQGLPVILREKKADQRTRRLHMHEFSANNNAHNRQNWWVIETTGKSKKIYWLQKALFVKTHNSLLSCRF